MTSTHRPDAGADASDAPAVVTTRAALRTALDTWRAEHPHGRRVVVMTMGALHAGHLELVRRARAEAGADGQVVVTDFVNPLQFGPGEDYERYPRDVAADVALLAAAGPTPPRTSSSHRPSRSSTPTWARPTARSSG